MARVTVEDCIEKVPNRFELVMLALQRSRNLASGAHANLPRDGDKDPVIALREIAESRVDEEKLWKDLEDHFNLPQKDAATVDETDETKLLEATLKERMHGKTSGDAGEADGQKETGEKEWSEEEMIRGLEEMGGELSP